MIAKIGNIVSVSKMLDPNGKNPKDRPAVVVGIDGEQLIVVAISSRMDLFNVSTHVKLPWEHGGHPRTGLNRGLSFSDDDRRENLRRAAEVARLLVQSGIIAICSFITPTKSFRCLARQTIGEDDFHEIYVHADFDTCRQRDVKGLYAKADQGQVKQFTGRDSGFEEPADPDLRLDTLTETEEESLAKLLAFVRSRIRPE